MNNKSVDVIIAGAGPGASDLITLRCKDALENAGMIIYAGSLVNPEILQYAKTECEILDSANMDLGEIISAIKRGVDEKKSIVRLHTGDPAIYGAISEQMNELDKLNISYSIIPGVTSSFASAAALNAELTMPGISQTIILTRRAGRTPVPDGQNISKLAESKSTMCIYLSISAIEDLVSELIEGGYTEDTAIAVVYRVTWDDERSVSGTLKDIASKVKDSGISRQAMIIVGDVLNRDGEKSLLYDQTFAHGYRKSKGTK